MLRRIGWVLAIILTIFISVLCACADQKIPVETPTGPTTPLPAASWSADGNITAGEYAGSREYGEYQVFWRSDEQYAYIGIRAKTTGYVAIGIQPGSRMKDADMIFGFFKDGKASVFDLYSTGDFGPHPQDTELGGNNNIIEFNGGEEDGFTTIEFKRALHTGDQYDLQLTRGVNKIIWAYGSQDDLNGRHASKGYGEIDLQ